MSSSSSESNKDHLSSSHNNQHPQNQETSQNLRNNTTRSKSKSRSPQDPQSETDNTNKSDPFFQDFYNRKKSRPRLSERIFNNLGGGGVFEKDNFVEDLRKQIEEERKMFGFDSDPFNNFPSHHARGGSPAPPSGGGGSHPTSAGSGSPRMGRAGGGFPFSDSARSRLDDFPGSRHPMFSTMRRPGWGEEDPFAGTHHNPFHHRDRHNSGSSGGGASGSSSASTGEEHIIPIRIERSDGNNSATSNGTAAGGGSGLNSHAKAAAKAANAQQQQKSNPISTTPIPMPAPEGMSMSPSPTPDSHLKMHYIPGPQRSSTDEVRKSPSPSPNASGGGERSHRAQSAPPDSADNANTSGKKFVSSINIEPQQVNPKSNNVGGGAAPSPQPTQFGGKCTKEKTPSDVRPIPIFVEGRGPVINNQSTAPPTRNNGPDHGPATQQQYHENNGPPQQQQQPKASRPAEPREVTPPPKKPAPPKDPLEKVADITQDVNDLDVKIGQFGGNTKDKEYLFLDEMLTRNLIKLDVIETEGREDVRQARKDCIKLIQGCIAKLESKVPSTKKAGEDMDIDHSASGDHQLAVLVPKTDSPTAQICGGGGDGPSSPSAKRPGTPSSTSDTSVKVSA